MKKVILTCSIVVFEEKKQILKRAIESFLAVNFSIKLYIIDHSPTNKLETFISKYNVEYIFNPSNPGFGAGHNLVLPKIDSQYHLILNPDIFFNPDYILQIIEFMDKNNNVGVLMPKVCLPNGEIQYTAKLLPTPFDFIVRRFVPLALIRNYFEKKFELRDSGYNKIMDVPFLSGCFMMFKTTLYKSIGGFDENIFMYTEDIDICRRVILSEHRAVFFPRVHIYHDFKKKSLLNFSVFKVYFKSAVYYFNKWGWLFDNDRKIINKYTLSQFRKV